MKVKHIALLKFKEGVTQNQIENCFSELKSLKDVIPGMESFNCGEYSSKENLNQAFTHAFEMEFSSEQHRDNYLEDPHHKKVATNIIQHIKDAPSGVIVFDFNAGSPPPTPRTVCEYAEGLLETEQTEQLLKEVCEKLKNIKEGVQKNPASVAKSIPTGFFGKDSAKIEIKPEQKIVNRIDSLIERIEEKLNPQDGVEILPQH